MCYRLSISNVERVKHVKHILFGYESVKFQKVFNRSLVVLRKICLQMKNYLGNGLVRFSFSATHTFSQTFFESKKFKLFYAHK